MKHTPPLTLTVCPDDRCLAPAEVVDDYTLNDSEGKPIRHRSVLCVRSHRLIVIDEEAR